MTKRNRGTTAMVLTWLLEYFQRDPDLKFVLFNANETRWALDVDDPADLNVSHIVYTLRANGYMIDSLKSHRQITPVTYRLHRPSVLRFPDNTRVPKAVYPTTSAREIREKSRQRDTTPSNCRTFREVRLKHSGAVILRDQESNRLYAATLEPLDG